MARTSKRKAVTQETDLDSVIADLQESQGTPADINNFVNENRPTRNLEITTGDNDEAEARATLNRRYLTFEQIRQAILNGGLVATIDDNYNIAYLTSIATGGDRERPPGIIEEIFLLPAKRKSIDGRLVAGPLVGEIDQLGRSTITTSIIPDLTSSEISNLKLLMYRKGMFSSDNAALRSLRSGSLPDPDFRSTLAGLYRETSMENFRLIAQGQKTILDVEDYLNLIEDDAGPSGTTSSTVSVFSPGDIDSELRKQYQNYVGRAPNQTEFEAFRNAVRSSSQRMPTVTTTTPGQVTAGGNATETTFRQEGFGGGDLSEMAIAAARANPQSAQYQKATKYFDAFLDALPPVEGLELQGADLQGLLAAGRAG